MLLRIVLILVALSLGGSAQSIADGLDPSSAAYKQIKALDAKIFDAYNTCDLATLADMVDDNLEFYHDRTGLSVGKASFINAIKNNICYKVRRELVVSSLEVFPLQDLRRDRARPAYLLQHGRNADVQGRHQWHWQVFHAVAEAGRSIPLDACRQLRSPGGSAAQSAPPALNAVRLSSARRAAAQDWSYGRRGRSDKTGCKIWKSRAARQSAARKSAQDCAKRQPARAPAARLREI